MPPRAHRRRFLASTAAAGAFSIVPRAVLGGAGFVAPSDRLALGHIAMGTQSFSELGALLAEPAIEIVAVCDPNADSNDYVEWSKGSIRDLIREYLGDRTWREGVPGCPGGREVGRLVVETYYSKKRGGGTYRGCRAYADFRELLEKEGDLDAVKVMTPDHLHATIAIRAMEKGKHVVMHKPIANRLREGRLVLETARRTKLQTHLLAYGSGVGNARIVEAIRQGSIGALREIHNWTNRPVWPQFAEIPKETPPVPKGFEWDLWLGPALYRPYHPNYTHTVFRGWYDFGGGSMADMGIYSLWPVFVGLDLPAPASAEAIATHACAVEDGVSRPIHNDYSYPVACTLRFQFPRREGAPALELFWYDGGMRPRFPDALDALGARPGPEGILFVGEDGAILAGFLGQDPKLYRAGKAEPLRLRESEDERARGGRGNLWLRAFQGGPPSPGSFLAAGPITDAVNLGTVALRAGQKVIFDSDAMKITNVPSANKYLTREYRQGWEL